MSFAPFCASAQDLPNGGSVAGAIAAPGSSTTYRFAAQAGENIVLRLADTSIDGIFFPYLALYGPAGNYVGHSTDGTVAGLSYTATVGGTYTVVVSNNGATGTGTYRLHFVRAPGANEHGALVSGGVRSEEAELGDIDSYTFQANAGENVILRLADTSANGSFFPYLALYGPAGNYLGHSTDGTVAGLSHTATATGTYTVVVHNNGATGTGTYRLHFVRAPGANEHGALINGGARTETAELGDLDSYTFWANGGENVLLRLADTSADGGFFPYVALYGPAGNYIGHSTDGTVAGLSYTTAAAGTYTVVVHNNGATGMGDYKLHFVRAPGANEHGALINGGSRAETAELGDLDSYTFSANTGENIALRLTDTSAGGSFFPYLALYGPAGNYLGHGTDGTAVRLAHAAKASGTYTVVVHNNGATGTGSYTLGFTRDDPRLSYVALGDSYSSGEGVAPYRDLEDNQFPNIITKGCHRSTRAYPTLVRMPGTATPLAGRADAEFDFLACSGAETVHLLTDGEGQLGGVPQLDPANAVDEHRDLVTVTIGGNDAQFGPIIKFCLVHPDCNGIRPFGAHSSITLGDFSPLLLAYVGTRVLETHAAIRAATPNAATLVFGYPVLLGGQECAASQFPGLPQFKLSASEQSFLRDLNGQVNDLIAASAVANGLHYIPMADRFEGHGVCGAQDDWVNGVALPDFKRSFHPTARGQLEYAHAANAYLEAARVAWPFGYLPSGLPRNPPAILGTAKARLAATAAAAPLPSFGDLDVALHAAPACPAARDLIVPGAAAAIRGVGFQPGEAVALSLYTASGRLDLGSAHADEAGRLDAVVTIPADTPAGTGASIEALGAGANGAGRLLLTLVRVEPSATVDSDADGLPDACDNCTATANAEQADDDADGYGNRCDADFDNNGIVNTLDLAILKNAFGTRSDTGSLPTDLDGNGIVNTLDLAVFKNLFGKPPGPSRLVR